MAKLERGYLGNPNIKGSGVSIEYTEEMYREWEKCYHDPVYFTEKYIKIINLNKGLVNFIPYDYQKEIIHTIHEERFTILACCRQSGKCFESNQTLTIRNKKTGEVKVVSAKDFEDIVKHDI